MNDKVKQVERYFSLKIAGRWVKSEVLGKVGKNVFLQKQTTPVILDFCFFCESWSATNQNIDGKFAG